MVNVDKNTLINNLCQNSGLQGAALSEYKARLSKMSEAELTALISGNNSYNNTDTVELNTTNTTNTPIDKSTAQDFSIENIESNANQALQMLSKQDDGIISKTYNELKEKFDLGLPKSQVEKVIYKQFKTADYLKKAKANKLTYSEYLGSQREFLMDIFPGIESYSDRQKAQIKTMIASLSIDELLEQEEKILNLPEKDSPEYEAAKNKFTSELILKTNDVETIYDTDKNKVKDRFKPKPEYKPVNGDRLMTFEEVYMLGQGVEFNKDNIQKSNESATTFALINNVKAKKDKLHEILHDNLKLVEGNKALGATKQNQEISNQRLEISILSALQLMYGPDLEKQTAALKELAGEDYYVELGQIKSNAKYPQNKSDLLPDIAHKILDEVDSNYNKLLGGKTLEDYAKAMANDYTNAYGKKDASALASSYVQDQEGVVKNVRAGVEIVGSAVMFGGMFFFPPAALAGGALASFGGVGVEMYNEMTKEHASQEKIDELKKELATNGLLMGIGMGAGKVGNSVKTMLTAKNAPKLLAMVGDVGADATISLLGDLALTGQINLQGEGLAQVMSLIAGHRGKIVKGVQALKENFKAKYGPNAKQMPDGTVIRVNKDGSTTVLEEGNNNRNIHPNDQVNHINQPDEGIPTIKQENTLSSTLSYKEIFENKKIISNQEANNILRKYNLTEADIAEIRNTVKDSEALNAYINAFDIVSKYDGDLNFNKMSVNEIKSTLLEIESFGEEIEIIKHVNTDNLKQIQHMFKTKDDKESIELFIKLWEDSKDNPDYEKVWNRSVEIFNQTGAPFKDIVHSLAIVHRYYPEEISEYTNERIVANKLLSDALGEKFDLAKSINIKDPSQITSEFIQEFKLEYDKLNKLNIETRYDDPVETLAEFKKISEFTEKYDFDFSWDKKGAVSRDSIMKLVALKDPSVAKDFIDKIPQEFKDKYASTVMSFVTSKDALNNIQDYIDFMDTYSQLKSTSTLPYEVQNPKTFISTLNKSGITDIGGVAKLLEAFNEVNAYPSWRKFFNDFNLKNGDYEEAAEYIKSLPEIFKDKSYSYGMGNSVENYITFNWNPDVDFKTANKRVKALKEKNLTFEMDKNLLQTIVSSKNDNIVGIFALLKDYGVNYDNTINDIIKNNNLSPEQLQEKIDILTNKLIKENPGTENIDPKFLHKLYNAQTNNNYILAGLVNHNWDINTSRNPYEYKLGSNIPLKYDIYKKYEDRMNNFKFLNFLVGVNDNNVQIADKILSDERLYNNKKIMNNDRNIIRYMSTPEQAKIADKIISDERLYNNETFMKKVNEIIGYTSTPEEVKIKLDIIDKILSDERLLNNENIMNNFGEIIIAAGIRTQSEITNKIFSDERLLNNKQFMDNAVRIIQSANNYEKTNAKSDMIDKILSDERLLNNEKFMNRAGDIIYFTNTLEEAKAKSDIIDEILSNKNFSKQIPNGIGEIIYLTKSDNFEQMKNIVNNPKFISELDKLNSKPNATIEDNILLIDFFNYMDKSSLTELSKVEKKDLLFKLLSNKNNLKGNNLDSKLIPTSDEGYTNTIKAITQSLNMTFKPLNEAEQKIFDNSLDNLANSLKSMDLSNLTDIKLSMPHTEFVSQVQALIKDLPIEEQAKIQDYFGFKIVDGKLTGYPNSENKDLSLSEISDNQTISILNKVKTVVDNYTDNNFITVKDNPILNQALKDISKFMPEIFNQIDGTNLPVSTIKSLQKVVQNPKFDTLSSSDKKVMLLSTLLHNTDKVSGSTSESAFDAYFISKRFNMSDSEAQKIYKIVESSDLINKFMSTHKQETIRNYRGNIVVGEERKDIFDLLAFNLKEGNNFKLAQILYSSKEQEGLTRFLDKALEKRIEEIKSNDFILPQTSQDEYFTLSKDEVIEKDGVQYNVKVVNSSDIDNFYALAHTPDAGFASGGSRMANFANFEIFKNFADDKIICAGYIGNGQAGLANEFHKGFIFEVPNDKQYVGYGTDIFSLSKNIPNMIVEYYRDHGQYANRGRGEKITHRTMISNELKSLLYTADEVDIDKKYIARLENIKQQLGTETMTMAKLQEIDPEFANAYKEFLSRDNKNTDDGHYLMRQGTWHNEILVSNPKITAIFTDNIEDLPVEYLQKAQEENLPIVIVSP